MGNLRRAGGMCRCEIGRMGVKMPWCFDDVGTVCRFSKCCCREGNEEMDLGSLRGRFELIWEVLVMFVGTVETEDLWSLIAVERTAQCGEW